MSLVSSCLFFFNDTATTEIYTLSLHDALPILVHGRADHGEAADEPPRNGRRTGEPRRRQQRRAHAHKDPARSRAREDVPALLGAGFLGELRFQRGVRRHGDKMAGAPAWG